MPIFNLDVDTNTEEQTDTQSGQSESPEEHLALRVAAIILFVAAGFMFIAQVKSRTQAGGSASNIPMLANIAIGIGLMRKQGFFNMSQNGYRIWAIVRSIASPIWIAFEASGSRQPGAYIVLVPDVLLSIGLLTLLFDRSTSRVRVIAGASIAILGFIGGSILLALM